MMEDDEYDSETDEIELSNKNKGLDQSSMNPIKVFKQK